MQVGKLAPAWRRTRRCAYLFALALSRAAAAQPPTAPPISYSATQDCPDEHDFLAAVARHLRGDANALRQPIVVELSQGVAGSKAHLEFLGDDGAKSSRDLQAPTCSEVASAAALIVALAIDTQRAARKTTPPAELSEAPEARTENTSVSLPLPAGSPPRDAVEPRPADEDLFVEAGGGGRAEYDLAPDPMFGGRVFLGIGEASLWNLRAHVGYAQSGVVVDGDRQARFTLLAGGVETCVWTLVGGTRWALQPCAAVELGRVESAGLETARYSADRDVTIWGAAGPSLRVQGTFDELTVEAYGGPWIPFVGTRTFVFEGQSGEIVFHRVPTVGWLGGIDLALRFD